MKLRPLPKINSEGSTVLGAVDGRSSGARATPAEGSKASLASLNRTTGDHLHVPGPEDAVWDAAPWLAGLREVPEDATWPRLMTLPHPAAVGSYGDEVVTQFRERTGKELRWWQQLAAQRLLEHDAAGDLVWRIYLLTLSRQLGKSWLLRELMLWRGQQMARWGDQLVVHTGKDLAIIREVMDPAVEWAITMDLKTERNNGRWAIHWAGSDGAGRPAHGRWIARSHKAVYGYSASNPMVDEAWAVPPRAVNNALLPTMVEQRSPQLGLISTAHPEATGLMLDRRVTALGQLLSPESLLLLEWSAPAEMELTDERGWRMASPHWTPQRRELIAGELASALEGSSDPEDPDPVGSFRAQWLDQWPHDVETREDPDERIASRDQWQACLDAAVAPDPDRLLVLAVEDDLGRGAAAAAAALTPDGRVVVGGHRFATLRHAVDWCEDTGAGALDVLLLAGASLLEDPELDVELACEPAGTRETRAALPSLRTLARSGRLAHDGAADVTRSVLDARVPANVQGDAMLVRGDALFRCVAWAVHRAHRERW